MDGKTLDEVLALKEMGVARFGVRHPGPLLDAWKLHLEAVKEAGKPSDAVLS